jgi:putative transposase
VTDETEVIKTMSSIDLDKIAAEIASNYKTKEDIISKDGLLKSLVTKTLQACLDAELTEHLGYEKNKEKADDNSRNGYSKKTIITDNGEAEISVPRDRDGSFEPQLIPKHSRRFDEFDDKILGLYARGMSVSDIQSQLHEMYGVNVSTSLISTVTDAVMSEVKTWQSRPLEQVYPILYLDCIVVKVREDKRIINKSVYLALAVNTEGQKELLGMWISQNEGAKFWLNVLTELKNRGLEDIIIACVDGLTGFPEAIEAVYPHAKVQLCIVHMVRNSMKYVSWKDRKVLAVDLKKIYSAKTVDDAESALTAFADKWDEKYPSISKSWLNHWENITPFFDYPADIRKAIYTTNAIESLNMTLRKVIKNKRVFPSDNSVFKVLFLAIENISKKWTMPIHNWKAAMNRFTIECEGRIQL